MKKDDLKRLVPLFIFAMLFVMFVLTGCGSKSPLDWWLTKKILPPAMLKGSVKQVTPVVITTTSCPALYLNTPYQCQFNATGGTPPYTWQITITGLPGLTANSAGLVSGTVPACSGSVTLNCISLPNPPAVPQGLQFQLADGRTIPITVLPGPKKGR
jgi:hypothetical protein